MVHTDCNISNPEGHDVYSVVGYETDAFGSNRKIAEISEEIISVSQCWRLLYHGDNYNSVIQHEVLWINGEAHTIRERENFEDILRGLS